jgi:hypothetical protein
VGDPSLPPQPAQAPSQPSYVNRPELAAAQQQIQQQRATYGNQATAEATVQAVRNLPANAQNVRVSSVPMSGPLPPGQTERPSSVRVTYEEPREEFVPPKSVSERILDYGETVPTLDSARYVAGRPGIGLGLPGQRRNPLSAPAGVVAAGESIAYSAPRGLASTASFIVDRAGFLVNPVERALGGDKAVGSTQKMFSVAAPNLINRVIPAPPRTVSGELITSASQGKATEGLGFITRNPAYALGSLLPEMLATGQLVDSAPAIKAGISKTANAVTERVISKTGGTTGFSSPQDYLDWNYRVRAELTPEGEAVSGTSLGERLVMKATGLRGREPVSGTMTLPTVENLPKEDWETYSTVEPANRVVSRATGLTGGTSEERVIAPAIREREPLDSIANMRSGAGAKFEAGMEAFDFESAPNTMNYGLSQPRPNPDLLAKEPTAITPPKVNIANLGSGVLVELPRDVPAANMFPEEVKGRKMPESLLEKDYQPPIKSEPLSFNNRKWRVGSDLEFSFAKENLPNVEDLVPSEPVVQTGKGGMKNIFRETPKAQASNGANLSYGDSGYSVNLVKNPISGIRFDRPMPNVATANAASVEEVQSFNYPAFSAARGMASTLKPIAAIRQGQSQGSLLNQMVIPTQLTNIAQDNLFRVDVGSATRQEQVPLLMPALIQKDELIPRQKNVTVPTQPNPPPEDFGTFQLSKASLFDIPSLGSKFMGGASDFPSPFTYRGLRSRKRVYPVLSGKEALKI